MADLALSGAQLVARILHGAWRAAPPPCELTPAEIAQVTPLLAMSGAAGLGWWRLKDSALAPHAETLRGSAQLLALEESVNNAALAELCAVLSNGGVTAMLFKGWAAAQSYPQGWLRPFGDFDLLVREQDLARARAVLNGAATRPGHGNDFVMPFGPRGYCSVDLHARLHPSYAADVDALFARARTATLPGGTMLVPSAEDHLRLCAIHMLRHGAWRPLWLCDVAAMSEAADALFDWDICLGERSTTAAWTAAAVMLAHRLLGARSDHLPPQLRNTAVPEWLEAAVLRHWMNPHGAEHRPSVPFSWRNPAASLERRWPDPVTATIWSGGLPEPGPRLHWQLLHCALTIGRGLGRRFRRS